MSERTHIRTRLLSGLDAAERAQVEDVAKLLTGVAAPAAPPADLEERTLAAVRAAGPQEGREEEASAGHVERAPVARPSPSRRRSRLGGRLRIPRLAVAGGLAVTLALGVLAGTLISRDSGLPGTLELERTLRAPKGAGAATVTVNEAGIGRVIDFRTDDLAILPKGEYYELWFVGPRDRPGRPNRISAGTFHPNPEGRSNVRFAAAVDPTKYPGLAVTAEPGDGNPAPSGPDLLRSPR